MTLRAPYPWFGGKSRVADLVWRFFGDVPNYVEPFFGSGAVLLARPHAPRTETINDKDCYVANFWRAVTADPVAVADACNWPVNEADLHARHRWLVGQNQFRERMMSDPFYYDVQIAAWWVWGISQWIGSGWCSRPEWMGRSGCERASRGVPTSEYQHRPGLVSGNGILRKRPQMKRGASGVHGKFLDRRMPDLHGDSGATGKGIHRSGLKKKTFNIQHSTSKANRARDIGKSDQWRKRPVMDGMGGVHREEFRRTGPLLYLPKKRQNLTGKAGLMRPSLRQLPQLSGDGSGSGRGVMSQAIGDNLVEYMLALADRLRTVRVCCGDWKRITGPSPTTCIGLTAVFLDPPYSGDAERDPSIYSHDCLNVAKEVAEWARAHGEDKKLRIALCGYEGEHKMPRNWRCVPWKANGGYGNQVNGRGKANAGKERVWFSPHCLK